MPPIPENLNLEKVSQRLNDVWLDLQEFYYSNTNETSFKRFKDNFRKVILIQNEITGCNAALRLIELGIEEGFETLRFFGIKEETEDEIRSAILRKETKLEFAKNKLDNNDKKQAVEFFKIVGWVEHYIDRQLSLSDINLERWIAYLAEAKMKHESEVQASKKIKNKKLR